MTLQRLPLLLAVMVALASAGCNQTAFCGARVDPILLADGGAFRCVAAEDCPRPANDYVCTTNTAPTRECVACVNSSCQRQIPEPCQ